MCTSGVLGLSCEAPAAPKGEGCGKREGVWKKRWVEKKVEKVVWKRGEKEGRRWR